MGEAIETRAQPMSMGQYLEKAGKRRQPYHEFQTEFPDGQSHDFTRIRAAFVHLSGKRTFVRLSGGPKAPAADKVIRS